MPSTMYSGKDIHSMYTLYFENDLKYVRDRTEEQL
jgi:hypothetical protein